MLERLLDSVILIDHFNNISEASAFIAALDPGKTAISVISYAEILVGFSDSEAARKAKALLGHYEILSLDASIAESCGIEAPVWMEASRCLSGGPCSASSFEVVHKKYERF